LRVAVAALLGPTVVLLLMAGTRPYYIQMTPLLTLFTYLFAHVLFWPPALATNFIGHRLGFKSLPRFVILMCVLSALLSVLLDALGFLLHFDPGGWRDISRNAGNLGVAGAGAYILYRVLLGRESSAPSA